MVIESITLADGAIFPLFVAPTFVLFYFCGTLQNKITKCFTEPSIIWNIRNYISHVSGLGVSL